MKIRPTGLVAGLLTLTATVPAFATDVDVLGSPGLPGIDGTPSTPDGGDGQPGYGVIADSTDSGETSNTATARGGNGGDGGGGSSPTGKEGAGGNGGNASATALAFPASGSGLAYAKASATGGVGGQGSTGGKGGNAVAIAEATAQGADYATSEAEAKGNLGGLAYGPGKTAGNGGTARATATATAQYGGVRASSSVYGGAGGAGLLGANGGNGADALAVNTVSGSALGGVDLLQIAYGGNGGYSDRGLGGSGGHALSELTTQSSSGLRTTLVAYGGNADSTGGPDITNLHAGNATVMGRVTGTGGSLSLTGFANAGSGGYNYNGNGVAGANATSFVSGTTTDGSSISLSSGAQGGSGGGATGVGYTGGAGGEAYATASALMSQSNPQLAGSMSISLTQQAGNGGSGFLGANGGAGGDSILHNAAQFATRGSVSLNQYVQAGNGGESADARSGRGGEAQSLLDFVNDDALSVSVNVSAKGGNGGGPTSGTSITPTRIGGVGGNGLANANISVASRLSGNVSATGGDSGYSYGSTGAVGGNALASFIGTGGLGANLLAQARGGAGGGSIGPAGNGAAGGTGNAFALAHTLGAPNAGVLESYAYAEAHGGSGGIGRGAGYSGGDGGQATARAEAYTTTSRTNINVRQIGGNGGDGLDGARGGNGASSRLDNAAEGTRFDILVNQVARGGDGGSSSVLGLEGRGGDAVSNLQPTSDYTSTFVQFAAFAVGGNGGALVTPTSSVLSGIAGSATSNVALDAHYGGAVTVKGLAGATGGEGGTNGEAAAISLVAYAPTFQSASNTDVLSDAIATSSPRDINTLRPATATALATATSAIEIRGRVVSTANATSLGQFGAGGTAQADAGAFAVGKTTAAAHALASGSSGHAAATSVSHEGAASGSPSVRAIASASATHTGTTVDSYANFNGVLPTGVTLSPTRNDPSAYALAMGKPSQNLLPADGGAPRVADAFAGMTVLGGGITGANYSADDDGLLTFSTSLEYQLETPASGSELTLGFFNFQSYGDAFQSLQLSIRNGDTPLALYVFTTLSDASAFLSDNALGFGAIHGPLDLFIDYQLTAYGAAGAGVSFLIGTSSAPVPLPPTLLFLLTGVVPLLWRRRATSAASLQTA